MEELFWQQQNRALSWWFAPVLDAASHDSDAAAPHMATDDEKPASGDLSAPDLQVTGIMTQTPSLPQEVPAPEPQPREPSIEEILASIRRIITDSEALAGRDGGTKDSVSQPVANGEAARAARGSPAPGPDGPVRAAFDTLLASRFAQHGDAVIALTREMLRPMLKAWLDENLPAMVERLVAAEIERIARGE